MAGTCFPTTGEALLYRKKSTPFLLATGLKKLDVLVGGGFNPGELVEIYGKSGTGKTQLCQKILASTLTSSSFQCTGENPPTGVYLDLHNDFSAKRFLQFCSNDRALLENVRLFREPGLNGVHSALEFISNELSAGKSVFFQSLRILIIDALPFALYAVMDSAITLRRSQENLVSALRKLASHHGIIVFMINHAVIYQGAFGRIPNSTAKRNPLVKPALGKYWSMIANTRLYISSTNDANTPNDLSSLLSEPTTENESIRITLEKGDRCQPGRYVDFIITKDDVI